MPKYLSNFPYPAALNPATPKKGYEPGVEYTPKDEAEAVFMANSPWFVAVGPSDDADQAELETKVSDLEKAKSDLEKKVKELEKEKTDLEKKLEAAKGGK